MAWRLYVAFTFHALHFHIASAVAGRLLAYHFVTFTFHAHHFHFVMLYEKVASVVAGRFLAGLFVTFTFHAHFFYFYLTFILNFDARNFHF